MEVGNSGLHSSSGTFHLNEFFVSCLLFLFILLEMLDVKLVVHVQHIIKYLPDLLSLRSELWSSFSLPASNRPVHGYPVNMTLIFCEVIYSTL